MEIPKEGSVDLVKQEMTGLQRKIEKLEYFITTMIFQTSLGKTKLSEDWKDEHLEDNQSESIPLDLDDLWDKIDECYSQFKNWIFYFYFLKEYFLKIFSKNAHYGENIGMLLLLFFMW